MLGLATKGVNFEGYTYERHPNWSVKSELTGPPSISAKVSVITTVLFHNGKS